MFGHVGCKTSSIASIFLTAAFSMTSMKYVSCSSCSNLFISFFVWNNGMLSLPHYLEQLCQKPKWRKSLRQSGDKQYKRNGVLKNLTVYSNVFTMIMLKENYLTADFKCFLMITSRSKKNCGKSCCNWMKKLYGKKNRQETFTDLSVKYKSILIWTSWHRQS